MLDAPTTPIPRAPSPSYTVLLSSPAAAPAPPPMPQGGLEAQCNENGWAEWHFLRFVVQLKQDYRARRAWHLANLSTTVEVVCGIGAIAPLVFVVESKLVGVVTAVLVLLTLVKLRSTPDEEARLLREQSTMLTELAEAMSAAHCFTEEKLAEYRATFESIVRNEFPIDDALERVIYNALVRKVGQPALSVQVGPIARLRVRLLYRI